MQIRKIRPDEVRRYVEFMTQFEQASSFVKVDIEHATKTYENMISSGIATSLVLEEDGEPLGSLSFIVSPDLHDGKLMAIETYWFMHPDHRGQGLLLFKEFERLAIEKGCQKLAIIHMMDSAPKALERLYIRNGYKLIEKHYVKEVPK